MGSKVALRSAASKFDVFGKKERPRKLKFWAAKKGQKITKLFSQLLLPSLSIFLSFALLSLYIEFYFFLSLFLTTLTCVSQWFFQLGFGKSGCVKMWHWFASETFSFWQFGDKVFLSAAEREEMIKNLTKFYEKLNFLLCEFYIYFLS